MKIRQIHIYGFGKWIDQKWDFNESQFETFLGDNESGKSTLMTFIHSIFFGFPSKRENQYIPRGTDRYGGSILIDQSPYEGIFIERTGGRTKKGTVTVHYPDGRSGDENDLRTLIKGIDIATFKGIFHFDLDGLQGMKDLTPKELNRYLYDAGMTGANKLTNLDKYAEQESERLFKPRGKKTKINELSNRLVEMKQNLSKWEVQLDEYDMVQELVREKKEKLAKINQDQTLIQQQLRKLDKRISISSLVRDWYALKRQEESEEKIKQFPLDGVHRLDRLIERRHEKEARKSHEKEKILVLHKQIDQLSSDRLSEKEKFELSEITEQFPSYKKMKQENEQIEFNESELLKQQKNIEEDWVPYDQSVFRNAHINGYVLEKNEQLKWQSQSLLAKEERLLDEKKKLHLEESVASEQLAHEEKNSLSEKDEKKLEKQLEYRGHKAIFQQEKTFLSDQFNWMKQEKERSKNSDKLLIYGMLVLSLGLLTFAVTRLFITDFLLFTVFLLSSLVTAMLLKKVTKSRKKNQLHLEQQMSEINSKLNNIVEEIPEAADDRQAEKLLKQHQERKIQVDRIRQKLSFIHRQQEQWQDEWAELQDELALFNEQVHEWCINSALPTGKELLFYEKLLLSIKEWKQLDKEIEALSVKKKQIVDNIKMYEEQVTVLSSGKLKDRPIDASIEDLVKGMQHLLVFEKEQIDESQRQSDKIDTHTDILQQTEEEDNQLTKQLEDLFHVAGVREQEEFREKAEEFRQQKVNEERLREWHLQMVSMIPNESERKQLVDEIIHEPIDESVELERLNELSGELEGEKNRLVTELSQLRVGLRQLEEDGTYEEQLQRFTALKEKVNDLAREWAVFKTSQYMIGKVKAIYEKERQPAVLKRAQLIFAELTDNRYPYLFAPLGEERFLVEREDGQRFDPGDLSRGTCELLYLSIRLALATEESTKKNFPFFLDETFVNMDKDRRSSVLTFLNELSKDRQILFFTCHESIIKEIDIIESDRISIHYLNLT
ncbi:AAA family ATPase [Salipaludibacillus sp. HK11]|uniref:AAA family ATPase n=1 Tax=Salipaludibacillus sp. HK11 TaxID=3394320 RepID=UPI0039FC6470